MPEIATTVPPATPIAAPSQQSLRERLHDILEHGRGRLGRAVTVAIAVLVMVSVLSLPFELAPAFAAWHDLLFALEVGVVGIFTVEYLARVYAAPSRWRYIFSWYGLIDLAAILPFYLAMLDVRIFRLLRLARLARILKIANLSAMQHRTHELPLLDGEDIQHVAQKHPVIFFLNLLPVLFFLAIGFGLYALIPTLIGLELLGGAVFLALLFFVKAWFNYSHDVIYVTNFRIVIMHRHFLGSDSHEIYYDDIVDVRAFHPHVMAYLLGYGSLTIETSAGTRSIELEQILRHEHILHYIDEKKRSAQSEAHAAASHL